MPSTSKNTQKSLSTRMSITEAIIELMKSTPYDKLRISAIAQQAGIARMTFYNYYNSVYDALTDYLTILVSSYSTQNQPAADGSFFLSYEHILYSLKFFDRYSDYFLILANNNLYSILIEAVNKYMFEQNRISKTLTTYELYAYAGGLLNTFLSWEQEGKKEPAEEVAKAIYRLYGFRV